MVWFIFSSFFILCLLHSANSDGRCPSTCECVWKSGKITAQCVGANLMVVPSGASKNLQVLDLSKNNFQTLPSKVFQERGLINLQKIFLSECKLGRLSPDTFFQLNNLVELDLSVNLLTSVPSESLSYVTRLRRLNLHKNPIRTIGKDSFSELTNLGILDLSDCEIESVEKGAFNALKALDHIKLDGNRLSTLPDDVFNDLPITNIGLHRNPWKCDCEVRPILEYLNKFKITPSVPPTCASPSKLAGLMWNSLELSAYACPPIIKVSETQQQARLASNISFECIVSANPSARINWSAGEIGVNSSITITEGDKFSINEEMRVADSISSTLTIHKIDNEDARRYYVCIASNEAETVSQNFTITLINSDFTPQWSKIEVITGVVISILALIVVLVLGILVKIRTSKDTSTPNNTVNTDDNSVIMQNNKLEKNCVVQTPVIDYLPKESYQANDGTNGAVIMITDFPPTQLYYNYENCNIFQPHRMLHETDEGYFENNFVPFISNETLL